VKRVGIIAGGMSSEHEISCISAGGVLAAIDRTRFEPVLIGISKAGEFLLCNHDQNLAIVDGVLPEISSGAAIELTAAIKELGIDVIFPVLHGPYGEDGTIQGLLEMAQVRYVGNGVLASAVAMDKSFAKSIFAAHGLAVAPGITIHRRDWKGAVDTAGLSYPLFVKPARGGSSKGTFKVKRPEDLAAAIDGALTFDSKVMVEEGIVGREIECAVLEVDGVAHASPLGEIKLSPEFEFYDFEAKYLDGSTEVISPDDLSPEILEKIQESAIAAFRALGCEGLARADFFYSDDGQVIINELNTMPGFTPTSVFPKLWARGGRGYSDLITTLIESALTRSPSVMR